MSKNTEHNTREHLLITGESLSLHKGFTAMGLSELLRIADVPKGSFYHYFPSKEAFGVAMLDNHYHGYYRLLRAHFSAARGNYRDRLLDYFRQSLCQFRDNSNVSGCLTVKLSAEVCDLSENMRDSLERGVEQVTGLLADALSHGREEGSLTFTGESPELARVLYALWLGANLQAKIAHHPGALESALSHVEHILTVPAP